MKQTAVEWFWDEIAEILPFTVDTETGIALYMAFERAKKMEAEQNKIPELSDEEIENAADNNTLLQIEHELFIDGAKWYRNTLREQLKQRQ